MVDLEQIYKWWAIFQNNGGKLCEVRCLDGKKTYSGYYHNIENLIRDVTPLSDRPNMQIYFVLNTINKDCYDRQQQERMIENPMQTSSAGISFCLTLTRRGLLVSAVPMTSSRSRRL